MYKTILIKDGEIYNIYNGIRRTRDVYIENGIIKDIDISLNIKADIVLNAKKKILVPGLVDAHAHLFHSPKQLGLDPDIVHLKKGVTFVIDQGSSGANNYEAYRDLVYLKAKTKTLAFLNCSRIGIPAGAWSQKGELDDAADLDENTFIKTYTKYKNELLGIKIRLSPYVCPHDPQGALEKVVHISKQLGIRMEVHPNDAAIEDGILFNMLRKNDIYTHTYHPSRVGILDENGNIKRCVLDARKRGVIFDTAHGVSSLSVTILKQALEQGFEPDMISTDLHNGNINGPVFDLPTTISKFINLGMPLQRALYKVTIAPTEIFNLKKQTEIMIDKEADIAAFTLQKGKFDFSDGDGHKFTGNQFLSPEFTILHSEVFFPN